MHFGLVYAKVGLFNVEWIVFISLDFRFQECKVHPLSPQHIEFFH